MTQGFIAPLIPAVLLPALLPGINNKWFSEGLITGRAASVPQTYCPNYKGPNGLKEENVAQ